jgi:hypothetical protein
VDTVPAPPGFSVDDEDGQDMEIVYNLRDDHEKVAAIQEATLRTSDFGIEPTHGLLGSREWWSAIESGRLPLQTLRGTISQLYMGSMGDWPSFELTTEDGKKSTCLGGPGARQNGAPMANPMANQ